jgi:hypothetical protein
MKQLFKILTPIAFLFLILPQTSVFAEQSLMKFSVSPIQHEQETEKTADLNWVFSNFNKASEINNLGFVIENLSDLPNTVYVKKVNLFQNGTETAWSDKDSFNETTTIDDERKLRNYLVDVPEKIELASREKKVFYFSLKNLPKIDGEIVGALKFVDTPLVETKEVISTPDKKLTINIKAKTDITNVILIKNSQTTVLETLIWDNPKVISEAGKQHFQFNLTNPNTYIVREKITLQIKNDQNELIKEVEQDLYVAPTANTLVSLPVSNIGQDNLPEGTYTLHIKGKETVELPFKINSKELRKIDLDYQPSAEDENAIPMWMFGLLGGLIIIILVMAFKLIRKSKKKELDV